MKKLFCILLSVCLLAGCSSSEAETVFDASKYWKTEGESTISIKELKEELGNPESVDNWFYESIAGANYGYKIKTLIYDNGSYEYNFNNGMLHRVTINKEIPYNDTDDFLEMFGLSKYSNTEIEDNGFSFRATNCGVHDLWIQYNSDNKTIENVKISYSNIFS